MNIGIYQSYWGAMGGGQRFIGVIAQILSERNNVEIVHHAPQFDRLKFDEGMELDLSRVSYRYLPRPSRSDWGTNNPFKRLAYEREFGREFSAPYDVFLESSDVPPVFNHAKIGIDLVHFPLVSFDDWTGRKEDSWRQQSSLARWIKGTYQQWEWRKRLGSYQRFWCNSRFTQFWTRKYWGVCPEVLNPPLRSTIHPMEKQPIILGLGAFAAVNHKRQDILINAFKKLMDSSQTTGWKLRLIGACKTEVPADVEFVQTLKKQAEGYPIQIETNVNSSELLRGLGEASMVWHAMGYGIDEQKQPGKTEHFGMVATEAMAAGAVPLVYRGGGLPEIITSGQDGFLWTEEDELIRQTKELINQPETLRSMSKSAVGASTAYDDAHFRESLRERLRGVVDI